jgi:hypothetical protein
VAKHDTDVTSLVFGLLFVGLAAVWALVHYDVLTLPAASVVGPAVLVVAGVAGLLLSLRRGAARRSAVVADDREGAPASD